MIFYEVRVKRIKNRVKIVVSKEVPWDKKKMVSYTNFWCRPRIHTNIDDSTKIVGSESLSVQ